MESPKQPPPHLPSPPSPLPPLPRGGEGVGVKGERVGEGADDSYCRRRSECCAVQYPAARRGFLLAATTQSPRRTAHGRCRVRNGLVQLGSWLFWLATNKWVLLS